MAVIAQEPTIAKRRPVWRGLGDVRSSFLLRRVAKALFTIFCVATLTFFLVRLMPGSPVEVYINTLTSQYGVSYEEAASQAASLFSFNPDKPLLVQYWEYLRALARGDFGMSLVSPGTPVTAVLATYLTWTLFSVGIALVISFTLGVLLGW